MVIKVVNGKAVRFFESLDSGSLVQSVQKPEYLIPEILVRGQPGVVGAVSKCLKTSICVDMAFALATGQPFLGRFEVPIEEEVIPLWLGNEIIDTESIFERTKVGFVNGESFASTITELFQRVRKTSGIEPGSSYSEVQGRFIEQIPIVWMLDPDEFPKLDRPQDKIGLRSWIREHDLDVLFLDPAYKAMPTAPSASVYAMGELLHELSDLCLAEGCTPIVVHHFRKTGLGSTKKWPTLEDLTGSGFPEWARQWLLLNRRRPYRHDGKHRLRLVAGGSAGHAGRWYLDIDEGIQVEGRRWSPTVMTPAEFKAARTAARRTTAAAVTFAANASATSQRDQDAIADLLARHEKGLTARAIRDELKKNHSRTKSAIESMLAGGRVVECSLKVGNQKTPVRGYRLAGNKAVGQA